MFLSSQPSKSVMFGGPGREVSTKDFLVLDHCRIKNTSDLISDNSPSGAVTFSEV